MAQYAVPISDISKVSWAQLAGDNDGDAFDELDEGIISGTPDDATTVWQTGAVTGTTLAIECGMGAVTDPNSSAGHIIRARVAKSSAGGVTVTPTIMLYQGTTLIASGTVADLTGSGYETISYTLSGAEADAITNYAALRIRVSFAFGTGTTSRRARISAMELEVPDVSSGSTSISVTDEASGTDSLGGVMVTLGLAESALCVDGPSPAASLILSETGTAVDALAALLASLGISDGGAGADTISQMAASLTVSDAGGGVDAIPALTVSVAVSDAGNSVDAAQLITEIIKAVVDTASVADSLGVLVQTSLSDSGSGSETVGATVTVAIQDLGSGADLISVLKSTLIAIADAASGTDSIGSIAVRVSLADTASGVDTLAQILALVMLTDAGTGVDVAVRLDAAVRIVELRFTLAKRSTEFSFAQRSMAFSFATRSIRFSIN